ncbi:hypothetical protein EH240_12605 [Mesorhizobium tamadayense]|uniref:Uncharacterized protein n=1 Tax=Mesorhizobium tamadayense TaxID=425306 RepID=A0A3P3FVA5_9HYPH|nr:hypothetical protein EH240_12605 [Mesorhizobium tamadayense]
MSDTSFPSSDRGYNRYLFEYRHGDAEWGIEIKARSPQEAKERIKSLAWARYKGEIQTSIYIPTSGLLQRIARRFLGR